MRQCDKRNEYYTIFEEDSELNLRVGWVRKKLLHVSVSFNIDILSGPWSISLVFSQEMVRLSNLDRPRAIGMVQSGNLCHDVALTFGVNKSTITSYRDTGDVKDRAKNGCPSKNPTETDNRTSGMAARRRFVTANGIRANV